VVEAFHDHWGWFDHPKIVMGSFSHFHFCYLEVGQTTPNDYRDNSTILGEVEGVVEYPHPPLCFVYLL
jgi:hypothetical protein